MIFHRLNEIIGIAAKFHSIFITVFFHSRQEPCDRLHKRIIVHHSIPLISLKPFTRITIMLRQNNGIWICRFYGLSELFPKFMIVFIAMSQICCNIKSPAINIIWRRHPFFPNGKNIIFQFNRFLIVQFRQCIVPPPAIIISIVRPFFSKELEELPIWTFLRYICSWLIAICSFINPLTVEPLIKRATVVEHTVQNHLHSAAMHLLHQTDKQAITRF